MEYVKKHIKKKSKKNSAKMVSFLWQDTIICKLDNKKLEFNLAKVAQELKLTLLTPESPEEWMTLPYFMMIANPNILSAEDINAINYIMNFNGEKEISILFTRKPKFVIPMRIRKFVITHSNDIDYEYLKILILNKRAIIKRHDRAKGNYDRKIRRLMFILLNLMDKSKIVTTQSLCNDCHVSEKTILRDIEMLRDLYNDIEFDKKQQRWVMDFSEYDFKKMLNINKD